VSSPYLGSLTVTHPFHPLAGRMVEVVYSMKRGGIRMFVLDAGGGVHMTVPVEWTDRGLAPEPARVSAESLIHLYALVEALMSRCSLPEAEGSS
jgi:diaminopimelate decarboxylase